ncbi:hypothetical protein MIMGU_mgv1a023350mg, partial [Erythranthe guttata]
KEKWKKGWVVVQVGLSDIISNDQIQDYCCDYIQRFYVPISYLYNPLFQKLLEKASEIYGYQTNGPLMLPCSVEEFLLLRWWIETVTLHRTNQKENEKKFISSSSTSNQRRPPPPNIPTTPTTTKKEKNLLHGSPRCKVISLCSSPSPTKNRKNHHHPIVKPTMEMLDIFCGSM